MNYAEAKKLILLHSLDDPDVDHPRWEQGFLGQLRPYRGRLYEENFHEVMAAIEGLAPAFADPEFCDREVVAALWSIVTIPRLWAFTPDGMLRRNGIISRADLTQLDDWLLRIAEAVEYMLAGLPEQVQDAMIEYGQPSSDYFTWDGIR